MKNYRCNLSCVYTDSLMINFLTSFLTICFCAFCSTCLFCYNLLTIHEDLGVSCSIGLFCSNLLNSIYHRAKQTAKQLDSTKNVTLCLSLFSKPCDILFKGINSEEFELTI